MKPLSVISPVMPFTTASCAAPGASASRFHDIPGAIPPGTMAVASLIVLLPLQRALAPLVDEPDSQHAKETDHREEPEHAKPLQADRPRKQECHFEIED